MFLQVLVEVCHVKLGLRPSKPLEEESIIRLDDGTCTVHVTINVIKILKSGYS